MQNKSKIKKFLSFLRRHKKAVLIFIIFFVLVFNMSFFRIVKGLRDKRNLENKILKLQKEIKILNKEIYNLKYNAAYIEFLARRDLAMCKPHEMVYKFSNLMKLDEKNS